MLDFLTLKPESFGLDLSDSSLKIVKLKKKRKSLILASWFETKLKPGIIQNGEIKNEDSLSNIIKDSLLKVEGEKINTRYVVASLPEGRTFLKVIQMPLMGESELKKAVYFEAENHIPLPIQDIYLDSQIIKPFYNHLEHADVLLVAQPKKIVETYASCLKKAGLVIRALESESGAIVRSLIKEEKSGCPLILIDIGASRTIFVIFSGHSLRFTTSVHNYLSELDKAISQALKVNIKEAEKIKLEYGIKFDSEGKSKKIYEAAEPLLTNFIEQIKRHLDYYESHASHEHLRSEEELLSNGIKIYLSGEEATLKGLSEFLSLKLNLLVEIGNPWINILPEPPEKVPELSYQESLRYTIALGLALRGVREE